MKHHQIVLALPNKISEQCARPCIKTTSNNKSGHSNDNNVHQNAQLSDLLQDIGLFYASFLIMNNKLLNTCSEKACGGGGASGDCVCARFADPIVYLTDH